MRFVTFSDGRAERVGVLCEDRVVPLCDSSGDLVDLIAAGDTALDFTRAKLAVSRDKGVPLADVRLLAPLRRFRRDILCTGWNYPSQLGEGSERVARPDHPTFFTKGPDTVIGPYDDIAYDPRVSAQWDYEAELAVVIGRSGRSIPRALALNYVWGYTLANDISQRDLLQGPHGGPWLKGKSIDATMPTGPCVVTPDELGDPQDLRLQCVVNGEVRQDASTKEMVFDVATLISELSFGMTLRPGDLLLTGTPAGVGNARVPQAFLTDGDEVVVRCDRIGELRNRVLHWDLATPSRGERP